MRELTLEELKNVNGGQTGGQQEMKIYALGDKIKYAKYGIVFEGEVQSFNGDSYTVLRSDGQMEDVTPDKIC